MLLISSTCFGLTTVTKIIDPDNGGGTDYTSLDAWEDALGGTTTGHLPNDDQIAQALCRSSSGGDDTTAVVINGWTTDATRYIEIKSTDFPSNGIYDGTKYLLHNNDSDTNLLDIYESYVRVSKTQILVTQGGTAGRNGIAVGSVTGGGSDIRIDSCIIKAVCSGGAQITYGTTVGDSDATVTIYNSVYYGFINGGSGLYSGIRISNATACNIYNCTISGNYYGIRQSSGTTTVKNCAIFNNTDDHTGTITVEYNATDDDGDRGANGQDLGENGSGEWTAAFTNYGVGDFSVKDASSLLYNNATATVAPADDIIDISRPQGGVDDIGAFELIVGAPAGLSIPIAMYHYQNH